MMGPKQGALTALFYEFSLEDHVPQDHLLRSIDRHLDLNSIRGYLVDFYSHTGRSSVDDGQFHAVLISQSSSKRRFARPTSAIPSLLGNLRHFDQPTIGDRRSAYFGDSLVGG